MTPGINMGSDGSRSNAALIVRDKVTRHRPQKLTFEERRKQNQTKALLLPGLVPFFYAMPAHRIDHSVMLTGARTSQERRRTREQTVSKLQS